MQLSDPFGTWMRVLHWAIVVCFLILAYTESMNQIFFSKEAIMKSFEFSFSALGYQDIPPLDRLFIARLERRDGWMLHYYAGVGFALLSILRFGIFLFNKNRRFHALHIALFLIILTQAITGYSLWAYPHIYTWQITTRAIHHYAIWALYGVVVSHFFFILWSEISGKNSGVISKMIGGIHKSNK
jgi:cytochrome b561